jgi:hypothetical protein
VHGLEGVDPYLLDVLRRKLKLTDTVPPHPVVSCQDSEEATAHARALAFDSEGCAIP